MNWLDWLVTAFLVISIVNGFREGFVRMGIGMAALVVGFFGASWFGGMAAASLAPYVPSKAGASILGFLVVFFGVLILGALLASVLTRILKIVGLSWFDRILGAGFGGARGLVVLTVVTMALTAFVPGSLPAAVRNSTVAPYVFQASRMLTAATPFELRDRFDDAYQRLRGVWQEATRK